MATSMEADSDPSLLLAVKEKREGKGVKTETAVDDATLQFDFRASTPATSPPRRGAEHRGGDGEEQRRIELKKFSLRPEKYDGKVDFEGWVTQFEEYTTLGQWNEEEKASLFFLSLTAGAHMYFVGLPEREKMHTLPEWKPSGVGLDRKQTPASLCRSWPDLEGGRTSRPRSWLTARGDWPVGPFTRTTMQARRKWHSTLSKRQ